MKRLSWAVVTLAVTPVFGAEPTDPVVCHPSQAPVVVEARTDGRLVAHIEFSAPDLAPCDVYLYQVIGAAWTVERCRDGACAPWPFVHPAPRCPQPWLEGRRCTDTERVVLARGGRGLYSIRFRALRFDGAALEGRADVRVGKRPAGAR